MTYPSKRLRGTGVLPFLGRAPVFVRGKIDRTAGVFSTGGMLFFWGWVWYNGHKNTKNVFFLRRRRRFGVFAPSVCSIVASPFCSSAGHITTCGYGMICTGRDGKAMLCPLTTGCDAMRYTVHGISHDEARGVANSQCRVRRRQGRLRP